MSKAGYQIRVLGAVPPRALEDFERVTVSTDPLQTELHAELVDEAELEGILDAIRRCGLVLLEVRREQEFD